MFCFNDFAMTTLVKVTEHVNLVSDADLWCNSVVTLAEFTGFILLQVIKKTLCLILNLQKKMQIQTSDMFMITLNFRCLSNKRSIVSVIRESCLRLENHIKPLFISGTGRLWPRVLSAGAARSDWTTLGKVRKQVQGPERGESRRRRSLGDLCRNMIMQKSVCLLLVICVLWP